MKKLHEGGRVTWRHRRGARLGPTLIVLALALGALALPGATAPRALAYPSNLHGGIARCEVCHTDNHTNWPVEGEKCLTCHTDFVVPDLPTTCWTCHTPGQDMSAQRNDTGCTAACHLTGGAVVQHAAHAGGGATCTQCHPLTPSPSDPGVSPHHTAPSPPAPVVAGFSPASGDAGTPVTVTGTGFRRAISVTFGGVRAPVFRVISDTEIATYVPVGALSGPVAVTTLGGTGTSTAGFSVPGLVKPALTLSAAPATLRRGAQVHVAGALTPLSLAGDRVAITVQRRAGSSWAQAAAAGVTAAADGSFSWAWRPPKHGSYRVRALVPAGDGHSTARSEWDSFRVR
jgi:hypothetical protein